MANAKKPPVKRTIVRVADAAGSGSADPAERSAARGAVKAKAGPKRWEPSYSGSWPWPRKPP
ncbi:MAG: hypothetical protein KBB32_06865 [Spirochaetia bacterium]|nr:hypothetical protein [Spirochaetia bacterium]